MEMSLQKLTDFFFSHKDLKVPRELYLILFFHFNQHQTPYSYLVDEVAYKRFFELIQEYKIPITINLSAPLLRTLLFRKSSTIKLIRQLKEKGLTIS